MKYRVSKEADLGEIAERIAALTDRFSVVGFYGEMGAGKTTLIKSVCSCLGVHDAMSSPTFSIVNEYSNVHGHQVYHFDLYRLKDVDELMDIGFEEYVDSGSICLIEWPEMAERLFPPEYLKISINLVQNNEREIFLDIHTR